ncbi:MAG: nuclear transport factor 2 family protein [Arenibacter latericius]|nr:nuclear transport factor 2 family protein [Arenibacter latericius]
MGKSLTVILFTFFFLSFSLVIWSQDFDVDNVSLEIQEAVMAEKNAFRTGDCDTVLDFMEENITFLANGRRLPSKEMIGKFCTTIPRPFKKATTNEVTIYPLTVNSGYEIRTLEYPKDEHTKIFEYVTRIWKKSAGKWRITHLHSTVRQVPIRK